MPFISTETGKFILGAIGGGLIDAGIEGIWKAVPSVRGKWPYVASIDPLPPWDDLVVFLGLGGAYAVRKFIQKKQPGPVMEGAALYGLGMFARNTLERIPAMIVPAGAAGQSIRGNGSIPVTRYPASITGAVDLQQ